VLRNGQHAAGLPPERLASILGRRAARDVAADTTLQPDDIA